MLRKLAAKNVKVTRPTVFNYIYTREEYEKYADELFNLMKEEKFDVRVHKTYPLKDAAQAHIVSLLSVAECPPSLNACLFLIRISKVERLWESFC